MTRDGKELVTPTFQVVGGERGVWLSELEPTGYLMNTSKWWEEGVTFTVTIRDENGGIATDDQGRQLSYVWTQTFDLGTWLDETGGEDYSEESLKYWLDDGHWVFDSEEVTPKVAGSDYWVTAGFGLWLESPVHSPDDMDAKYTITYAGQVNLEPCTLTFRDGKNPIGNMFPVGIRLSSLTPQGYLMNTSKWWEEGVTFSFIIRDENGGIATDDQGRQLSYVWTQTFDLGTWLDETGGEDYTEESLKYWINDGHWVFDGDSITIGGDTDPTFDPGQGLWVEAPIHSPDDLDAKYTVTFTAPAAK